MPFTRADEATAKARAKRTRQYQQLPVCRPLTVKAIRFSPSKELKLQVLSRGVHKRLKTTAIEAAAAAAAGISVNYL